MARVSKSKASRDGVLGGEYYLVGGQTQISDHVLEDITEAAALEVDGVLGVVRGRSVRNTLGKALGHTRGKLPAGVLIEAGKKQAIVDVSIEVMHGFSIPQIVIDERRRIGARLLELTGLVAKEVNVHIASIAFPQPETEEDTLLEYTPEGLLPLPVG